jgi:multiple sugar transport system substrate-binding protein
VSRERAVTSPLRPTRRAVTAGLAAAGATYALWPLPPRGARPRGRTVLRYWEKWSGREGDAVQRVVDRFNASQSRIWVERVPVGEIYAKAMVAIGGGDPPDVVGLFSWNVPTFADAGALLPLDEFAPAPVGTDYAPAIWKLLTHTGRPWAGVNTCYTLGLYYDRVRCRELGFDPEVGPVNLADLDALAERGLEIGENGRVERAGFLANLPGWWPYFWPIPFGGTFWDEAERRLTLAEDGSLAGYRWVREQAERLGAARTQTFAKGFERSMLSPADPFLSRKVAAIVQGPWMANFIDALAPDLDYGVIPVPQPTGVGDPAMPTGLLEADVIAIPRGCPHPEEAYEFVAFTQRPEVQAELCREHGKSSPMMEVPADFAAKHKNRYVNVHDAIAKSPAVQVLPEHGAWKNVSDLTVGAFERIWMGADPARELAAVQRRGQELFDDSDARRARRLGLEG